jgi:hypothetical protein
MREAAIVIVESGLGVAFTDLVRQISPRARIIYNASDDLSTIGCSSFLQTELERVTGYLDWAGSPKFYAGDSALFHSSWRRRPGSGSRRAIAIWTRLARGFGRIHAF